MIRTGITYRFKQRVTEAGTIRLFYGSSRWSGLATGRERRGKRLIFEFSWYTTTSSNLLKINAKKAFDLSHLAFYGTSDQFAIN